MNLIGPNWKTTLSGIGIALFALLNALALAPTELGDFGMIIPPAYKAKILMVSLGAAFVMRVLNAMHQKSANVTGGNVQQTLGGNYTAPGDKTLVDLTKESSPPSEQAIVPTVVEKVQPTEIKP